jgi:hypothetical protein
VKTKLLDVVNSKPRVPRCGCESSERGAVAAREDVLLNEVSALAVRLVLCFNDRDGLQHDGPRGLDEVPQCVEIPVHEVDKAGIEVDAADETCVRVRCSTIKRKWRQVLS